MPENQYPMDELMASIRNKLDDDILNDIGNTVRKEMLKKPQPERILRVATIGIGDHHELAKAMMNRLPDINHQLIPMDLDTVREDVHNANQLIATLKQDNIDLVIVADPARLMMYPVIENITEQEKAVTELLESCSKMNSQGQQAGKFKSDLTVGQYYGGSADHKWRAIRDNRGRKRGKNRRK